MIVDLHVHVFPPRMFAAVWEYFETRDWPVHKEHVADIDRTLAEHGVSLATGLSYPHKPGVAEPLNRFMESVGRDFSRFRPFASVHVDDDDLRAQVDHAIASPHLHGFKFQPLVQRFDINDPRLDHLYERCVEASFPLIMHVGTAPMANPFVGFSHFRKLLARFPELPACVAHMGAFESDDFLRLLGDHPQLYLDTTMINVETTLFDTTYRGDPELLFRHGDRICFGSDWPNVPYDYEESLRSLERFGFDEAAMEGVRGGNAVRFLGQ